MTKDEFEFTHLLLMTGPEFDFMHLTLRIWTPTGQVEVMSQRLVPLRSMDTFSIQGPQAEVSQWKTIHGWLLQTLHSSRAVGAGHAFPSKCQKPKTQTDLRTQYNVFTVKKSQRLQKWGQFLLKVHKSLIPLSLQRLLTRSSGGAPQPAAQNTGSTAILMFVLDKH